MDAFIAMLTVTLVDGYWTLTPRNFTEERPAGAIVVAAGGAMTRT